MAKREETFNEGEQIWVTDIQQNMTGSHTDTRKERKLDSSHCRNGWQIRVVYDVKLVFRWHDVTVNMWLGSVTGFLIGMTSLCMGRRVYVDQFARKQREWQHCLKCECDRRTQLLAMCKQDYVSSYLGGVSENKNGNTYGDRRTQPNTDSDDKWANCGSAERLR